MNVRGPNADNTIADLLQIAGIELSEDERRRVPYYVKDRLAGLQDFVARAERTAFTLDRPEVARSRDPGRASSPDGDPLRCLIWQCEITGAATGLLARKRFVVKDNIPVAGLPLTFGSSAMQSYVARFDASVITRLLDAGATLVGKANMDDFSGFWGRGFDGFGGYDRVVNPSCPNRVSGGSSSGSAVAVAAGLSDFALGGDQGGSIRIPASFCGVYGLKPTFGLVPHTGIVGSDPTIDHVGPIAGNLDDLEAVLRAISGSDGLDFRQALSSLRGATAGGSPTGRRLRLGMLREGFRDGTAVSDHVRRWLRTRPEAKLDLVEVGVDVHLLAYQAAGVVSLEGSGMLADVGFAGAFHTGYYPVELAASIRNARREHWLSLLPFARLRYVAAVAARRELGGQAYGLAHNLRPRLRAAYDSALTQVDALVMPACPVLPPLWDDSLSDVERLDLGLTMAEVFNVNTFPFNLTGHPALTIPIDPLEDCPIGLQLVGDVGSDLELLSTARALEQIR